MFSIEGNKADLLGVSAFLQDFRVDYFIVSVVQYSMLILLYIIVYLPLPFVLSWSIARVWIKVLWLVTQAYFGAITRSVVWRFPLSIERHPQSW